ncbi:ABC transporter ATP-binding protein [Celeribacter ethanolicus]|uniref:ABC transporter ATP-binding protein n=1 Tax=Celeribacter ethanolicus TaxID=1758178 RepID=A0A291GAF2_9RHOB|nr:sugar ABC transporter ATP-binding protein [Celeribacter ethanolicus]ATG47138.1 ABC transporter ATP-binding protein [Celeribacter ethanolicus]
MSAPLIEMQNVSKDYRGVFAVRNVDFNLHAGEIHALLGENGAGKSTLTKMIAGVTQRSEGEILLDGKSINFATPAEALDNGIAMVFQETSLVPSMTVAQNLYLGEEKLFNRLRGLYIAAQQFLSSLNFNVDPWANVSMLGAAQKQLVEIARAVRLNARVIIFDEPTATLTPEEKHYFFSLIERLRKRGVSIVFISHALEEALAISDRITILRDGELVASDTTEKFDRDSIIGHMVGRSLSDELFYHKHSEDGARKPGKKVLSVENLSMGSMVRNTSFSLYEGQVTGLFGLIGSGRTETAKIIAGVLKRNFLHGGELRYLGKSVRYRQPHKAVMDGIVYVTEDRKAEGFFDQMSIAENIYMGDIVTNPPPGGLTTAGAQQKITEEWSKLLQIRAINPNAKIVELSGGNQQKVVIAKSLTQKPKLVIFDEPTRGVDVGAIAEIHKVIQSLADSGIAVLVISSYLPEILVISDRILVSRLGRVVEEFSPSDATEEKIMYAAVH